MSYGYCIRFQPWFLRDYNLSHIYFFFQLGSKDSLQGCEHIFVCVHTCVGDHTYDFVYGSQVLYH